MKRTNKVEVVGKQHRKLRVPRSCMAIALGLAALPMAANAVSFSGNNWKVDISGFINAFYTTANCQAGVVGGTAVATQGLACGGESERTTIGNGLLPNALITKFSTVQDGIDITAQTAFMTSIATGNGLTRNNSLDVRQAFFTLGTANFGTVELGRDYGLFGYNAIIHDNTLLGVGAPAMVVQAAAASAAGGIGRVSLGHIGVGYAYVGTVSQFRYTTPTLGGFSLAAAVVNPGNNNTANYVGHTLPQLQVELNYAAGPVKLWAGAETQKFVASSVAPAGTRSKFWLAAAEAGGTVAVGPFDALVNVQYGNGVGILIAGDQGAVVGLNYIGQVNYHVLPKLTVGVNYGMSRNLSNSAAAGNFQSNSNITGGLYYHLTKAVQLDLELGKTYSKDYLGRSVQSNNVSVGGFIFF